MVSCPMKVHSQLRNFHDYGNDWTKWILDRQTIAESWHSRAYRATTNSKVVVQCDPPAEACISR